jgi:cytidine deaminase
MDPTLNDLIQKALAVRENAYVPYSRYPVGAALQSSDGRVFTGCNVENAAYPACICAERSALVKAISEGSREFDTIVVATENGGSPCGMCRQMLFEFAPDLRVVMIDNVGTVRNDVALNALLLHGFGPSSLTPQSD